MSPSRRGASSSVPSRPAARPATPRLSARADDRGDVGRLELAQLVGGRPCSSSGVAPSSTTAGPAGTASRTGSSATYSGCDSGSAAISSPNTSLTQVEHRPGGAEVAGEPAGRGAERGTGARGTWRCRRGGSGRSTASGRRRRRVGPGRRASSSQSVRACVGVARREQGGELDLDRVGVLELVEQQTGVPRRAGGAGRPARARGRAAPPGRARAGRGTRARRAARRTAASRRVNCASSHGQPAHHGLRRAGRQVAHELAHGGDLGPDVVGRARGGPVVLPAVAQVAPGRAQVDQAHLLVLVGRVQQLVVPVGEVEHLLEQLVGGIEALGRARPDGGERDQQRLQPLGERRRVGLGTHALGDEVPVGVARQREGAQHRECGVGVEREEQCTLERRDRRAARRRSGPTAPRTRAATRSRRAPRCAAGARLRSGAR